MAVPPPLRPTPIGFAHRGARAERRDNTLEAFALALELGASGLESDAWLTGDGAVILDHDGVTGPIWRRKAISAQPRSALPSHIPSLGELYSQCGSAFELSLDVKDPAALEGVLSAARRAGAAGRLWLCHDDWRPMAAWRSVASDAHLVESSNIAWMREGLAARAAALQAAGIDALNLHRSQWDAERVSEVHSAGILAFAWDAQSPGDISFLLEAGVDAVYSDHVETMMRAINTAVNGGGCASGDV